MRSIEGNSVWVYICCTSFSIGTNTNLLLAQTQLQLLAKVNITGDDEFMSVFFPVSKIYNVI